MFNFIILGAAIIGGLAAIGAFTESRQKNSGIKPMPSIDIASLKANIINSMDEFRYMVKKTISEGLIHYDLDDDWEDETEYLWKKKYVSIVIENDEDSDTISCTCAVDFQQQGKFSNFFSFTYDTDERKFTEIVRNNPTFKELNFYENDSELFNAFTHAVVFLVLKKQVPEKYIEVIKNLTVSSAPNVIVPETTNKKDNWLFLISDFDENIQSNINEILDKSASLEKHIDLLDSEAKHDFTNYVNKDLPKLVHTFSELSVETRKEKGNDMLKALEGIKNKLSIISHKVDGKKATDFEAAVRYIEKKNDRDSNLK